MKVRSRSLPMITRLEGRNIFDFQGAISQSQEGDALQLVHVAERYDNVYVYNFEINRIIGYLERELADDFIHIFGKGFCLDAKLYQTYTFDNGKLGCDIEIYNHSEYALPHLENLPYLHGEENFEE